MSEKTYNGPPGGYQGSPEERRERFQAAERAVRERQNGLGAETPRFNQEIEVSRKFTDYIDIVENVVIGLLVLYGVASVIVATDVSSAYSSVPEYRTGLAWVVGIAGVFSAVVTGLIVDVVAKWLRYSLTALLDIKDNTLAKEETVA